MRMVCPFCGPQNIDENSFEFMILLGKERALAQYICPECGQAVTSHTSVRESMREHVDRRLRVLSQRYPNTQLERYPNTQLERFSTADEVVDMSDVSDKVLEFKEELDTLDSIDDVLEKIESARNHGSRD